MACERASVHWICRRVGGVDEVVHGLGKVVQCLRKVSPRVIGRLNWMCTPVIIPMWAICDIGPPVMVNGTYGMKCSCVVV